jgi:hypothetical protein
MGEFINNTDFTGRYQLASNPNEDARITAYILDFEKSIIYKIFGIELGKDVIANPLDTLNEFVINEFTYEDGCVQLHSKGLKNALLGIVYWHIITEGRLKPSPLNGVGQNKVEVKKQDTSIQEVYSRWNESVDTIKAIQSYLCIKSSDYPTYKGLKFLYNW